MPHERIILGIKNPTTGRSITIETLKINFAHELEIAELEMHALALTSLTMKMREGNMTSLIWYQKNRMGWSDGPQPGTDLSRDGGTGQIDEAPTFRIEGGLPPPPDQWADPPGQAEAVAEARKNQPDEFAEKTEQTPVLKLVSGK